MIIIRNIPKRILLKDGNVVSVAFGDGYKSSEMGMEVNSVEIGYPLWKIKSIMKYAQNKKTPTSTVYGFVPVELLKSMVEDEVFFSNGE